MRTADIPKALLSELSWLFTIESSHATEEDEAYRLLEIGNDLGAQSADPVSGIHAIVPAFDEDEDDDGDVFAPLRKVTG